MVKSPLRMVTRNNFSGIARYGKKKDRKTAY